MAQSTIRGKRRVRYASLLERTPTELRAAKTRSEVRAAIAELKRGPCSDYGGRFDPVCMDFDHRPYEHKVASVSSLTWAGLDRVLREVAKCDLVCANCHRLRTKRRGQHKPAP